MKYRILLSVLIFAGVLCKAEPMPKDTILTSSTVRLEESDLDKMAGLDFRKRLIGQIPGLEVRELTGKVKLGTTNFGSAWFNSDEVSFASKALLMVFLFRSRSLFLNLIRSRALNMLLT